jgi:hypothetical protein
MQTDGSAQRTASIPRRFVSQKAARSEKPQQHGGEVLSSIALLPSAYTKSETAVL